MNINLPETPGHYGVIVYSGVPTEGESAELTMAREMVRAVSDARRLASMVEELSENNRQLAEILETCKRQLADAMKEIERLKGLPPVETPAPAPAASGV